MPMYIPRGPLRNADDLDQGDILARVWRPGPATGKNILALKSDQTSFAFKEDPFKQDLSRVRVACSISVVELAIVISNSCDNTREGAAIELAPLCQYKLEGDTAAERWREISEAATGTAAPKFFYLPSDRTHGLPRSEAVLHDKIVVTAGYLKRCAEEGGTTRVCGLTDAARRHLQWTIAVVYGRNARDDFEWLSEEDAALKLESIEEMLARKGGVRGAESLREQRERLRAIIGTPPAPAVRDEPADGPSKLLQAVPLVRGVEAEAEVPPPLPPDAGTHDKSDTEAQE
jgi:hypothetical protein